MKYDKRQCRTLAAAFALAIIATSSCPAKAASLPRVNRGFISDYITYPVANVFFQSFVSVPSALLGVFGVLTPQERVELSTAPSEMRMSYWLRDVFTLLGPCFVCKVITSG